MRAAGPHWDSRRHRKNEGISEVQKAESLFLGEDRGWVGSVSPCSPLPHLDCFPCICGLVPPSNPPQIHPSHTASPPRIQQWKRTGNPARSGPKGLGWLGERSGAQGHTLGPNRWALGGSFIHPISPEHPSQARPRLAMEDTQAGQGWPRSGLPGQEPNPTLTAVRPGREFTQDRKGEGRAPGPSSSPLHHHPHSCVCPQTGPAAQNGFGPGKEGGDGSGEPGAAILGTGPEERIPHPLIFPPGFGGGGKPQKPGEPLPVPVSLPISYASAAASLESLISPFSLALSPGIWE